MASRFERFGGRVVIQAQPKTLRVGPVWMCRLGKTLIFDIMLKATELIKATFDASWEFFRPPLGDAERPAASTPVLVPIRTVDRAQRERITAHLLGLSPHDRYLRFGYAANDEQIARYVDGLDFERDELFGIYNRRLDTLPERTVSVVIDPPHRGASESDSERRR